ncbi:unnamed protein product [Rhizoctonia solani]|uniref:Uncharacterized protein n=1 Tax=Rhizoctonia solani TaxID=456999 RepID=A0A8H3BXT8_9AGAM|nr:unnamed protein product [Rhizoctonia solani]CAE6522074.1 unnamed protein product [Rhizoctonia solani]
MSTAPPSYDAANAQLTSLEASGLTPQAKAMAQQAAVQALSAPQTTADVLDEIKGLSATAVRIDQDFHKVYIELGKVDNAGFNFPRKLAPEWKVLKDRWTKLLWNSRNTASKTVAELKDWHEVIVPAVLELLNDTGPFAALSLAEAREEIRIFRQRAPPFKDIVDPTKPGGHSQEFTELQRDIEAFKESFDNFTKAQQAQVEAQIAGVKNQINSMNAEISKCDEMARRMGLLLGITLFATGVGAIASLVALGPLGPLVAFKILIVGAVAAIAEKIALINYQKRAQQLRSQVAAKNAELRQLEDKLALLKKCEAMLEAQKATMGDIASRIGRFSVIWAVMQSDAAEVEALMERLDEPSGRLVLRNRINAIQATYAPLREGLKLYATQIDNSGVAKS